MEVQFRPIVAWPGKRRSGSRSSQFRASYTDTLQLLDRELGYLKAKNIVIQLALGDDDIRLDGMPRRDARPSHPGVILSFDSKHGPLSYPCDTYPRWEDNLRAIALALENLRAVDRYGVTMRGEQYQGWKALPGPMQAGDARAQLSALAGGMPVSTQEEIKAAYRKAAFEFAPDRNPGDADAAAKFLKLQEIKAALDF